MQYANSSLKPGITILVFVFILVGAYPAVSQQGLITAPNGSIVSNSYFDFFHREYGQVDTIKVRDGVYTIAGYGLSNLTFIEGKTGLIVFDAGNNIGQGRELLKLIRTVSDNPIKAIIYSHHHYTGGARVFVEDNHQEQVPIYGHPKLQGNMQATSLLFSSMQARRVGIQLGLYLPRKGPDAYLGPPERYFEDPDLNANGHVPPTHDVKDGESVIIDGVRVIFYHIIADTDDSIIAWFPDLDLALHNSAAVNMYFSLYTLRGDFYRSPEPLIAGVDRLRTLKPEYVVGVHGFPLIGREQAYATLTRIRDGYAFAYQQSVRAINAGMTPDEMVQAIKLPTHLAEEDRLYEGYIRFPYALRGFYRGIVGWYAEDTADLNPPEPKDLGIEVVAGFGGEEKVIERARAAMKRQDPAMAAKLVTFVLQARHLEGKMDWTLPPEIIFLGKISPESAMGTPPGTFIKLLETRIVAEKSADIDKLLAVHFTDLDKDFGLHVRRGVAEFIDHKPERSDYTLALSRQTWLRFIFGEIDAHAAFDEKTTRIEKGTTEALIKFFGVFDDPV